MGMKQPWIIPASIATILSPCLAQPSGLYCSCPPTTPTGSVSVVPAVAALDFVDGFLVRVAWKDLEPSPGVYEWSLIDGQIQAADAAGKSIALAVVNGPLAPDWLAPLGVEMFFYRFRGEPAVMPVPWDGTYLGRWTGLVEAVGKRYAGEGVINLVYITNSTANGFEMQLPFAPVDTVNWTAAGYTDQRLEASWRASIDAFAAAFPDHNLSHEVHPVLGSDAVARSVTRYAHQHYGDRIGTLGAWWMVHNALDVYPGMYDLLVQSSLVSHAQVQVANSFTATPERFGLDGLAGVIDLAIDSGIGYMEIWNSDLLNPELAGLMADTQARLSDGVCPPDLADPSGSLDFFDLARFLTFYNESHPAADLAAPFGVRNFFDIAAYISRYAAGCP